MAEFNVTSEFDPFLHVSLSAGESITCESDSMVMMESNLDLSGELSGGFFSAITRSFANDESLFQQKIIATRGAGDCLLAPVMSGGIEVLDIGAVQYRVSDGAFMACTDSVHLNVKTQNISTAIFGGTGGFLITETSGHGKLAVNGFGTIFTIEVTPNNPIIIDNGHVVAWDSRLSYELSVGTKRNSGLISSLVNSFTSGEGIVLKFSGSGRVILCSRNKGGFILWIKSLLGLQQ